MKTAIITISEEVINYVNRPVSMFLNDLEIGTKFTHVQLERATEYKIVDNKTPTFVFASDKGGRFKFTMYDIKRFKYLVDGVEQDFLQGVGKAALSLDFEVANVEPAYVKDTTTKQYPPFCYSGFDEHLKKIAQINVDNARAKANGEPEVARLTAADFDELYASEIKDGSEDKFYRILTLDRPLVTFGEPKAK